MESISRTIRAAWKRSLISAAPVAAGLLAFTTMAHAQDSISNFSHNSRSFTQVFAEYAGYIILFVGLSAAWMRRSTRIGIASLVVGTGLLVASYLYNALSRSL